MKKFMLIALALLSFANGAFAQVVSTTSDLVYTPVTPCRLFDSRLSQGGTGPIAAAGTKSFLIWGQTSYAAQGGDATNCGLLAAGANVAAVAINLTVVTPAAGGFVTAYPFGWPLPAAATVNFQAGDIARGNFTIAKISQAAGSNLSVYSTSLADVVGDVVGYYAKPAVTALQCANVKNTTATVVPVGSSISVVDSAIAACPATHTGMNYIWQFTGSGGGGISVWNNDYGTQLGLSHAPYTTTGNSNLSVFLGRRCCRIP